MEGKEDESQRCTLKNKSSSFIRIICVRQEVNCVKPKEVLVALQRYLLVTANRKEKYEHALRKIYHSLREKGETNDHNHYRLE